VSEIVDPNLRAALLAEGEGLFKERSRLEARLAALDNLHDCLIEAAALDEINQQRARNRARVSPLDICARMQLRDHPLISYRGLPSWPPVWTPANPKSHLKPLRGEIGRLEHVLPNKTLNNRCFLSIEHEGNHYVGCLFFDDSFFCNQMIKIIENQAGLTIKEIGDLDLSYTL